MSAEIINPNRYKKTTRKKANKQKAELKYKEKINHNKKNQVKVSNKKAKINKKTKFKRDTDTNLGIRLIKITILVLVLIGIGMLSKKINNLENFSLNVFSNKDENTDVVKDYYFNIALLNADSLDMYSSKNVILNELVKTSTLSLVKINSDYTLEKTVAKSIDKIDELNYSVKLNNDYKVDVQNVIDSINKVKELSTNSPYYNNVKNIETVNKLDENTLTFKLVEKDSYFPYRLNFPLYIQNDNSKKLTNFEISDKATNSMTIVKNESKSSLASVKVTNYTDENSIISDFRNSKFDMFVVSTDAVMQQIGKHEYNIKKYRDGETTFLLGNKNSKLFSRKEVRQAIAYSINRDEIVKSINPSFSEIIDIPYIYSSINYKYDIYGAKNTLLSNGWSSKADSYYNNIDGIQTKLELNLLVNKDDAIKVNIANKISEMLKTNGIVINVISVDKATVESRVSSNNYDLVLADIYINDNPDISMIYNYINLNDNINNKIEKINSSTSSDDLQKAVDDFKITISDEIACIGIMAKNTNVVYQKNIVGFDNTMYMKLFNDFLNINKTNK